MIKNTQKLIDEIQNVSIKPEGSSRDLFVFLQGFRTAQEMVVNIIHKHEELSTKEDEKVRFDRGLHYMKVKAGVEHE